MRRWKFGKSTEIWFCFTLWLTELSNLKWWCFFSSLYIRVCRDVTWNSYFWYIITGKRYYFLIKSSNNLMRKQTNHNFNQPTKSKIKFKSSYIMKFTRLWIFRWFDRLSIQKAIQKVSRISYTFWRVWIEFSVRVCSVLMEFWFCDL